MFSQNELILMIIVVSVLLVSIIILTILDIKEYKRNKNNELNELEEEKVISEDDEIMVSKDDMIQVEEVNDERNIQEEIHAEPLEVAITNEVDNIKPEPFFEEIESEEYEESIPEPEISYQTYVENKPEVEKEEKTDINAELEKIENTIEPDSEKVISTFEEEQERTAIISLDELMKKTDTLYSENEILQYDDGNEPISLDEVLNMYNKENVSDTEKVEENEYTNEVLSSVLDTTNEKIEIEEVKEEKKELYTKKETIPFISIVTGLENDEMSFENTANYEKFTKDENAEFMQRLKRMNENK